MTQEFFVEITFNVPGTPPITHIAELHSTDDPTLCIMCRIIELSDSQTITGLANLDSSRSQGMSALPQRQVPHPNSYLELEDFETRFLSKEEFEGLWVEAQQRFPDF